MPFNGSGTFSIVNTFVPNTTILSAAVNQNFSDIATGLSDCLTRDGQAGMSAVFKAVSGSVSAPGISFNSDTTAGLFLSTTGIVGLVAKSLGLLVNSSVYQVSAASVQAGGSGYAVGDTITLTGGTAITQAVLTVATLSGSAVATATVTYPGNYTVKPADPVSQGSTSGSGTSATFNLTWTTQYTRSVVTSEAGAAPWERLGSSSFVSGLMPKANAYDVLRALVTIGSGLTLSTATSPPTVTTTLSPSLVPNYISGLVLNSIGTSGTFGLAVGVANDTTNVKLMQIASAYTKTTSSWAVGSGNGALDTGAIATNTWYHVFLICRTDTNVVDVLVSTSATAPTMPTNYTLKRRIGSMKTNGSSQWTPFTQFADEFLWDVPVNDVNTTATPSGSQALSVPPGVSVMARMVAYLSATSASSTMLVYSGLGSSQSSGTPTGNVTITTQNNNVVVTTPINVITDTSRQVRLSGNGTSTPAYGITTYGWKDWRGALG